MTRIAPFSLLAFFAATLVACDDQVVRPGDASGPSVRVVPSEATLVVGQSLDFDVIVDSSGSESVTWSILADPAPGEIDPDGVYTAPLTVPSPPTVVIEATVQAGRDGVGRAEVTIVEAPLGSR